MVMALAAPVACAERAAESPAGASTVIASEMAGSGILASGIVASAKVTRPRFRPLLWSARLGRKRTGNVQVLCWLYPIPRLLLEERRDSTSAETRPTAEAPRPANRESTVGLLARGSPPVTAFPGHSPVAQWYGLAAYSCGGSCGIGKPDERPDSAPHSLLSL